MAPAAEARRASRPGNLPAELTSFVGRERELTEVTSRLSTAHLLSLVGPGGVGKTRLAVRAAARVARAFPDGTWLVELGALRDPTLLAEHVAATLGLRDESGRWVVATLSDWLARRRLLLVLDNCEHVLDACAALVRALLQEASELRILATSREPLALTAESLLHVGPLDADGAALQLLVDRASAVRPEFRLTDATRPAALELCRRLDGIPLAIELAAARLRGIALDEIVARLDDRFALLTAGDRGGPLRQQTLRATLDWSYELLTDDERALWRRLAPFAGTFDTGAALAICADEAVLPTDRVGDTLAHLVERSIIQLDDAVAGRYRLLETIHDYAVERAAEHGELEALRARHRDHYLDLARRASRTWGTADQVAWFRRLAADYDNLRVALDGCRDTPDAAPIGLEVAAGLTIAWQAIGRMSEGHRWVSTFLALVPEGAPSRRLGLWAAGYMAIARRDLEAAEEALTEALRLADETSDEDTKAWAVCHLGLIRLFQGKHAEARALLLDSVERHRRVGRPGIAAFMLADAAIAAVFLGRTDEAIPEFEEALRASRDVGDRWTESHAAWGLGLARVRRGEAGEAEAAMRQSLQSIRDVGDATGVALSLEGLAVSAAALRQPDRAAWLVGVADAVWEAIPARPPGPILALREQSIGVARAALGERKAGRLVEDGRAVDAEAAIVRALDEDGADAPPEAAPAGERPELSRREQEVALLVAEGLTNRQIAERLVLSPRTVESHVERIMNRLGMSSRSEIAAWTATHLSPERAEIP